MGCIYRDKILDLLLSTHKMNARCVFINIVNPNIKRNKTFIFYFKQLWPSQRFKKIKDT